MAHPTLEAGYSEEYDLPMILVLAPTNEEGIVSFAEEIGACRTEEHDVPEEEDYEDVDIFYCVYRAYSPLGRTLLHSSEMWRLTDRPARRRVTRDDIVAGKVIIEIFHGEKEQKIKLDPEPIHTQTHSKVVDGKNVSTTKVEFVEFHYLPYRQGNQGSVPIEEILDPTGAPATSYWVEA